MITNSNIQSARGNPLSPRSLALSALLGSHPPALPTRAFMALAAAFDVAPGTMRTALSRLVTSGDIELDDGWYRLGPRFLSRQAAQDRGRRAAHDVQECWRGDWHTVVTLTDRRSVAERRDFRRTMADARFAELRPDIWMRPANLPAAETKGCESKGCESKGWMCTTGPISGVGDTELTARLWPLAELAAEATSLIEELATVRRQPTIPTLFLAAATTLRFLRRDPLLPSALEPDDWPVEQLRADYDTTEAMLQPLLRELFRKN